MITSCTCMACNPVCFIASSSMVFLDKGFDVGADDYHVDNITRHTYHTPTCILRWSSHPNRLVCNDDIVNVVVNRIYA